MDSDSGELSEGELSPGPEIFNSKNLALQAQKKILSKMATMAVANLLTDDTSSSILDAGFGFSTDELEAVERFRKKLNQAAMTAVSFHEVEFTFDRGILSQLLLECRDLLHEIVENHLTSRSHARIDRVFNHFADVHFLAELYGSGDEYRLYLSKICDGINKLLDEGIL
ncbi:hypothetical protein AMELA_G00267550 [Ameiurus melas]|uniref:Tumor necrosis factor alpha-induced protein 8-like protein n=1 Tax=Ameiurus melas TaxID=219545 RepID=A0A7J5ZPK6_AMEME|nr:hypothetical protein AMELA_G00267550 [Ameiurus melas]